MINYVGNRQLSHFSPNYKFINDDNVIEIVFFIIGFGTCCLRLHDNVYGNDDELNKYTTSKIAEKGSVEECIFVYIAL